jgi:hypothetical protein
VPDRARQMILVVRCWLPTVERHAVEAVIWGMPAVYYDLMLQEMLTKTTGEINQIVDWSRPVDWKNQTLTPNPDSIYLMTFFNTKDVGPLVIEVPPAEDGSFIEKVKSFNPDPKTLAILNTSAREAHAWLDERYDTAIPSYYEGSHWRLPASRRSSKVRRPSGQPQTATPPTREGSPTRTVTSASNVWERPSST